MLHISNKNLKEQYDKESYEEQMMEVMPQPMPSCINVPSNLTQLEDFSYARGYHQKSPSDQQGEAVYILHHSKTIKPIQPWIEEACRRTHQLGNQLKNIFYDLPSRISRQACTF